MENELKKGYEENEEDKDIELIRGVIKAKLKFFHNILKHSPQKDFLIVSQS